MKPLRTVAKDAAEALVFWVVVALLVALAVGYMVLIDAYVGWVSGTGGDPSPTGSTVQPPAGGDLDCADVNGPITVTGDDPHGLDADGDGIACE